MNTSGLTVGPITCMEKIQWEPVFYRTIFWSLTHYVLVFIALFSCSRSSQLQARYSVLGIKIQGILVLILPVLLFSEASLLKRVQ